jgi:nitrite reductase/ring-hydroxylating ferredoxin subunit/multimeric flavodoxin WrbA
MDFIQVASLSELPEGSSKIVIVKNAKVVLFHFNGKITAIGNACLHKGGPLGLGCVENKYGGTYVTCPWHGWEYNIETGKAPPNYHDQQSVYEIKIVSTAIFISVEPIVKAKKASHDLSSLIDLIDLKYQTTKTSLNIVGISTTNMNENLERFSTSEDALEKALGYAKEKYKAETKIIKLRQLNFRHCEGYYSQHMSACTWPCSITEMDPKDGMTEVYRETVLWADILLLATPIRWGNASSLYYKMAERFNTVQNQITLNKNILIKNKVAAFIITGGQDNIQSVAGQLMWFFTDLGFVFPPFSFVGWSRGWTAEDMDKNVMQFKKSDYIKRSTEELVDNCIETLSQIKNRNTVKIIAPKPHRQDSLSADIENPDMNL